ncbi:exocyst complex component 1 [Schistosoma mansoni]|uniref:exocyst complex component 1 n=1 Tax=Schistosoma mansoni TaxID=6183 RepID=UPI0001A61A51|nr:exocyst complex component 1 [Schistosoma mansoni]|eukprot:XP_018649537.1 exocyst complex component 1 [Schistosoma mansoni]
MSDDHSNQLSRLFYPINERVGLSIGVISGHQSKHKRKHLVFTISLTKPTSIQVYLVKITDKNEIKKVQVCNAKNLKKIDCRDTKTQPSYELQIITENKIWVFNALKLEEKRHFISSFCRTLATLLPHVIKDIELVNFPQDINISPLSQNETLDALLNPEYMSTVGNGGDEDGVGGGDDKSVDKDKTDVNAPVTDSYHSLTKREEDDIRQFLDELDEESTLLNAAQLTERLQEQLAHIEGTNVHSIMSSESQVLSLMTTLDSAIERAELLEKQLNNYYSFLEEVEDAMATLRDHDQLIQTTVDNRANLLNVLEQLVDRLDVDPKYLHVLTKGDLSTSDGIALCIEAAGYLDRLLNSEFKEGEEHLQAVDERMQELRNLRDSFATKLSGFVNDAMLRYASQLGFVVNTGISMPTSDTMQTISNNQSGGGGGSRKTSMMITSSFRVASDLYAVQRTDLLQLTPLVGNWLQANRKDLYIGIKRMYIEKSQSFFKRQIQEVLKCTQDSVANLVRPGKSKEIQRLDNIPSDVGSVMSLHNLDSNLLTQVESIFDSCFDKIITLIRTEQAFLNQFFGFHLNTSQIEKSHNTVMYKNYKGDELSTLFDCMVHLFDNVEQDILNLITYCEQLQSILIMPLLITISPTTMDNSTSSNGIGNTSQLQLETQDSDKIHMTYIANFLSRLTIETKRAFNRLVERLIISFKTSKACKKVRCGVLPMVRTYIEFAECSMTVFAKSSRLVDLERAHRELVRCLMTEIDRVASRSVKTPGEVVQLGKFIITMLIFPC